MGINTALIHRGHYHCGSSRRDCVREAVLTQVFTQGDVGMKIIEVTHYDIISKQYRCYALFIFGHLITTWLRELNSGKIIWPAYIVWKT